MFQLIGLFFVIVGGGVVAFSKKAQASLPQDNSVYGPVSPYNGPVQPYSQDDYFTLARTLWGEARGEGVRGMQAVANVIMNRYRLSRINASAAKRWGDTVAAICTKSKQFSVWNIGDPNRAKMQSVTSADPQFRDALAVADKALRFVLPDITSGSTSYYTGKTPYWAAGETPIAQIGSHTFLKDV